MADLSDQSGMRYSVPECGFLTWSYVKVLPMAINGIAGFWSYSHDDNERDGNGLMRLANRIKDEFSLVTGESLTLFVDRQEISWGQEWRRRVDSALTETTFFIPVLTPLYFRRDECRRELLSFVGQAESLGAIGLVMPILYVDVPGLTEDSADEARALVARMQYIDWRELRLSSENSSEYKRGVHSLAMRLAEISHQHEQAEAREVPDDRGTDEDGLIDILAELEATFPAWREILDDLEVANSQLDAVGEPHTARLKKLAALHGTATSGQLLIAIRNLMRDAMPFIEQLLEGAKSFAAASVDLDPKMLTALRLRDTYPEASTRVAFTMRPIESAVEVIERLGPEFDSPELKIVLDKYKGLSKDAARALRVIASFLRYWNDAVALVLNWNRELQRRGKSRDHGGGE